METLLSRESIGKHCRPSNHLKVAHCADCSTEVLNQPCSDIAAAEWILSSSNQTKLMKTAEEYIWINTSSTNTPMLHGTGEQLFHDTTCDIHRFLSSSSIREINIIYTLRFVSRPFNQDRLHRY